MGSCNTLLPYICQKNKTEEILLSAASDQKNLTWLIAAIIVAVFVLTVTIICLALCCKSKSSGAGDIAVLNDETLPIDETA